ncbi:hypothetical protein M9H77_18795 [Catharanthus roseus]|uniref:Uncharacterized protein n=1 Tax=Catharanthus roseus TaxID=4058 RepID=A0ACC0B8E8_CATRO|nr:hypothetical protein M9H77_18795 [Catharanthus roseus]
MLLLLCFSRKLLPGSWPDVDTKEDAEIKEKIPPVRGSKTKSAQKIIAPSSFNRGASFSKVICSNRKLRLMLLKLLKSNYVIVSEEVGFFIDGTFSISEDPFFLLEPINIQSIFVDVKSSNFTTLFNKPITLLLFRRLISYCGCRWTLIDTNGGILDRKSIAFNVSTTIEQNAIKLLHKWQFIASRVPRDLSNSARFATGSAAFMAFL